MCLGAGRAFAGVSYCCSPTVVVARVVEATELPLAVDVEKVLDRLIAKNFAAVFPSTEGKDVDTLVVAVWSTLDKQQP